MNTVAFHGVGKAFKAQLCKPQILELTAIVRGQTFRQEPSRRWTCSDCLASIRRTRLLRRSGKQNNGDGLRHFTTTRLSRDDTPSLPSKIAENRSELSTRITRITDSILARASIAGQHINVYTGTDYSGIEALRQQIMAQEALARSKHGLVDAARITHSEAHTAQAVAQKEIVGLLERKSSWTPANLERYMSLVRSEHTNDQAVQAANDGLAAAERDLENARGLLERLERKQYHEEQIWSDTIRRNSTWVTFGLMGVNIVLLLAQIAVFEPYRRRKIVREVERVVEQKAVMAYAAPTREVETPAVEGLELAVLPVEARASASSPQPTKPETVPDTTALATGDEPSSAFIENLPARPAVRLPQQRPDTWTALYESYVESFQDLFSERLIQLKKVDVTTTALQGAATGVAAMGLLFVLLRPR